jgi:hypothetical protein
MIKNTNIKNGRNIFDIIVSTVFLFVTVILAVIVVIVAC